MSGEDQSRDSEKFFRSRLAAEGFSWAGMMLDAAGAEEFPFRERPKGSQLDGVLVSGDAVIVPVSIRAFVGVGDLFGVVMSWSERGVRHHLLDLGLELDSRLWPLAGAAARRLMEAISAAHSELLSGVMGERKRRGRPTGKSPYGYRAVGPVGDRRWVPDRELRAFGARVVEMREAGRTWESMYFEFLYGGVRRSDGGEWSITAMRRVYEGEVRLREKEARGEPTDPPAAPV